MTTLIYKNGTLMGDRRFGVRGLDQDIVFIDKPKIWQHPNRHIAFGICGEHKGKNIYPELGDVLIDYGIKIEQGLDVDWTPIWDKFVGETSTIVLMTKRNVWAIVKARNDNEPDAHGFVRFDLDELPWFIVGSGQHAGGILLAMAEERFKDNIDYKRVYDIVAKVDSMTSSNFDTILQKDLLVFKGVKK